MKFVSWMNGASGRLLRVGAGAVLIVAGALVGGAGGIALAVIGLVPLVAGATGVCLAAPLLHTSPRTR